MRVAESYTQQNRMATEQSRSPAVNAYTFRARAGNTA
jgi:hypothetical protein